MITKLFHFIKDNWAFSMTKRKNTAELFPNKRYSWCGCFVFSFNFLFLKMYNKVERKF